MTDARAAVLICTLALFPALSFSRAVAAGSGGGPAASEADIDRDSLQPLNRKVFWFNDRADVFLLEPVAKAWNWILPHPVQRSVANFFSNLRFPVIAVNNLLQGKPRDSVSDVGRFAVNSTVGVAGFFDPATGWGLPAHEEDFGQTLGRWGVPAGPYLVLPFLGASNPRDGAGMLIDWPLSVIPFFIGQFVSLAVRGTEIINTRSVVLDEVRDAKAASLDYYTFVRNAYRQHRRAAIDDAEGAAGEDDDDLYSVDFGDDE